ncbi:MAG: carbohydrate-binding domain-containing protein [Lachnospiraceae bacterium]|nr:carbohydrate-binding domain-containing protein [Lachnospiraceae bacterium]
MYRKKLLPTLLVAVMVLCACAANDTKTPTQPTTTAPVLTPAQTDPAQTSPVATEPTQVIEGSFKVDTSVANGYTISGSTCTITKGGAYLLSGVLEGNIIIDVTENANVELMLAGVSVTSTDAAPVYVQSANNVTITAKGSTENLIADKRAASTAESETNDPTNAPGAIYADCDLELKGQGALYVKADYNNGVHTKDDLDIKNLTLTVTANNVAIRGNDSVNIASGTITAISVGGDGIKTTNSKSSNKGKQKGDVTISSGSVDIYAAKDGISAVASALIGGDARVSIHTDSYSSYSQAQAAGGDMYIVIPSDMYSEEKTYWAYYYNEGGEGVWKQAQYATMVSGGRNTYYYGLKVDAPSGYSSVGFYIFAQGVENSLTGYEAASAQNSVNAAMNGYLVRGVSDTAITGDFVSLAASGNDTSEYSTKGIKAGNEIAISGGSVTIESVDDGLHAAADVLDSGAAGSGNILINGGTVTITSGDDGIHADGEVTIDAGTVNVAEAYEGVEGSAVTINGGEIRIYATDDGINAGTSAGFGRGGASSGGTGLVSVNGGYLEVATGSGDTDAIDVNGSFVQTAGFVLVRGGASAGNVCGSVDVDGTITVSGGTIVALGGICETPQSGSVNTYISSGTRFGAGEYVLKDADGSEVFAFTLASDCSGGWIASEGLAAGTQYTLTCDGSEVVSWTQDEGTTGSTGSGGFGPGGGMGPGGGR